MVFIMHCCEKIKFFLFGLVCVLTCAVFPAHATDIAVDDAQLVADENDGYSLTTNFTINLGSRLEEIVNRGVSLYFVTDFELTRSRWYWFDEKVVRRSRTIQLSYHALTRQFRLSSGTLHQSFSTLREALSVLSRLRQWPVIEKNEIDADTLYQASVRLRLDPSLMPKTFQVNALSDKELSQSSEWLHWDFSVHEADAPTTSTPVQEGVGPQ